MRRRVERMRAEAATEAESSEASEASERGASRARDDDDEDAFFSEEGLEEDFLSGLVRDAVASAVSAAARGAGEPRPAAERAPFDVGDLDDSSAGGHAVIHDGGRGDEVDR